MTLIIPQYANFDNKYLLLRNAQIKRDIKQKKAEISLEQHENEGITHPKVHQEAEFYSKIVKSYLMNTTLISNHKMRKLKGNRTYQIWSFQRLKKNLIIIIILLKI